MPAPGQAKKVAMLGSLDHVTRQLIVHTSPTKRSSDFIAHLDQLDRLFAPQPGRQAWTRLNEILKRPGAIASVSRGGRPGRR